jgi:hypothetical protein
VMARDFLSIDVLPQAGTDEPAAES